MNKKMIWDSRQKEFIFDHSGRIDENGIAHFHKSESTRIRFGDSVRYPDKLTLVMPSDYGICLVYEGMHFVID